MVLNQTKPFHRFFEEISLIPHGSGNEKALSAYLIHFAQTHPLSYKQDDLYNVIIYKCATPGYETQCIHYFTGAHGYGLREKSKLFFRF